jgi:rhodanese-related sulfurtransferase
MQENLRIDAAEAKSRVDAGRAIVLDVVSPMAWETLDQAVRDAVRIPPDEVPERLGELPRDRDIIAYCT